MQSQSTAGLLLDTGVVHPCTAPPVSHGGVHRFGHIQQPDRLLDPLQVVLGVGGGHGSREAVVVSGGGGALQETALLVGHIINVVV